jgi:hypothetical protein
MESISLGRHPKELYEGAFTRSRFWGNVTVAGDRFKFLAVMPAILALYCSQSWSIPLAKAKWSWCRETAALKSLSQETDDYKPTKTGRGHCLNSSGDHDNPLHNKVILPLRAPNKKWKPNIRWEIWGMEVCSSITWNWKWSFMKKLANVKTLGKLESRPGKRNVFGTKIN